MNNDDIRKIAEGMGLDFEVIEGRVFIKDELGSRSFYPDKSWNDCGLIINSIIDDKKLRLNIEFDIWHRNKILAEILQPEVGTPDCYQQLTGATGETLLEAICQAYLNLIGE